MITKIREGKSGYIDISIGYYPRVVIYQRISDISKKSSIVHSYKSDKNHKIKHMG